MKRAALLAIATTMVACGGTIEIGDMEADQPDAASTPDAKPGPAPTQEANPPDAEVPRWICPRGDNGPHGCNPAYCSDAAWTAWLAACWSDGVARPQSAITR